MTVLSAATQQLNIFFLFMNCLIELDAVRGSTMNGTVRLETTVFNAQRP